MNINTSYRDWENSKSYHTSMQSSDQGTSIWRPTGSSPRGRQQKRRSFWTWPLTLVGAMVVYSMLTGRRWVNKHGLTPPPSLELPQQKLSSSFSNWRLQSYYIMLCVVRMDWYYCYTWLILILMIINFLKRELVFHLQVTIIVMYKGTIYILHKE